MSTFHPPFHTNLFFERFRLFNSFRKSLFVEVFPRIPAEYTTTVTSMGAVVLSYGLRGGFLPIPPTPQHPSRLRLFSGLVCPSTIKSHAFIVAVTSSERQTLQFSNALIQNIQSRIIAFNFQNFSIY